jgi:leader peptidase (prepilin peptidase) / N-methyltransferase
MIYFWLIIGAVVGSFLNVCIHRLPREESVVFPSSHCPACGQKLVPLDLVPVISYLFLRGRCRYCGAPIAWRYPLVEGLTALGFALAWSVSAGDPIAFLARIVFVSALIVIFFIDLEHLVIPDAVSLTGLIAGLLYNSFEGHFFPALAGALLGFALLYAIGFLGKLFYHKEIMGEGDLLLAAFMGAYLGWAGILLAVGLAYLLAALVIIVLLALRKVKMDNYIPFGPALAAGGFIALFWGNQLIAWYLGSFWR